ncbi:MAG: hypothetical protein E7524_07265 [Ruminococcaceae bacterium]|jgi:hypothetical protein|nr:hypothetical protein [Oscillospiraceae bacterium]
MDKQEQKKQYLSAYLLQEAKIERLKRMIDKNPANEKLYKEYIEKSQKIRTEIEEKISAVDDELLSELLFQKYVFGHTLEQVGYIINYSKRQTERLHRKALEKLIL